MPQHRAGEGFSGSHTTVTDSAAVVVDAARKIKDVSKIILGRIQRGRNSMRRLKFKEVAAGWQIDVIDNASIQTLFVYTTEKESTRQTLYKSWPGA